MVCRFASHLEVLDLVLSKEALVIAWKGGAACHYYQNKQIYFHKFTNALGSLA